MTKEDKVLLIKDLCMRLPYYPKCQMIDELRVINNEKDVSYISVLFPRHIELLFFHNNFSIKPYLRSMSSMTEEEWKEYQTLKMTDWVEGDINGVFINAGTITDWLNKYHFDYRGLIPKGLAIEVTESNNPYKIKI